SYRVYATLLRNGRDCRSCHLDEGPKLGSVFIRLPAAPFRRLIRTAQISLLVVGIVALGLSVPMTRVALGRYLGRPRSRPPAAAPARSDSRVESRVAAVAPGGSVARPPGSPPTGAPQRDDLNTLYYIAEQLSRTIAPNVIGRRAVELASSVFGSNCVLIAGHFHADARAFHGTVAYQGPGGEIIERPYPDELVQDNAPFYNVTIVERWLRGELDGVIRFREGSTVAYPLERHGRRLGLILAPARSRNESLDGRPTMAHPDVVEAARKHLAIALELSELERERLLQERLAAIGQTVAGLAHCLKNTLNGLKGGQYVVERALRTEDPEKLRKGWNVLTAGIQHIERLTLDMLIYAGEKSLDRKPANPNEIMQEVIDLYEDSAGGKGVHLRAELDQRMEPVWVDRHALYRAVLNLVTNAIDACVESESGSTVILRSQSRADHVLLTVEDNGVGIPKASLRRVTERFFTTKGSNGTGLGLPVVMKIAEQHGGTLEVESVFGQGSAFHLRIPKGAPSQKSH
ncbi:MAG: HAMP domain-containing histidine kinase, partial [Acidobacteria bacterium]|nr:HAMP domain-containing histidine kinase [Acidobacteriota bacterium]